MIFLVLELKCYETYKQSFPPLPPSRIKSLWNTIIRLSKAYSVVYLHNHVVFIWHGFCGGVCRGGLCKGNRGEEERMEQQ